MTELSNTRRGNYCRQKKFSLEPPKVLDPPGDCIPLPNGTVSQPLDLWEPQAPPADVHRIKSVNMEKGMAQPTNFERWSNVFLHLINYTPLLPIFTAAKQSAQML